MTSPRLKDLKRFCDKIVKYAPDANHREMALWWIQNVPDENENITELREFVDKKFQKHY